AVVEQVSQERRKHDDIGERREGRHVPDRVVARRHLDEKKRRHHRRTPADRDKGEAEGMNLRPPAEKRGVEGVDNLRDKKQNVANVESQMMQYADVAVGDHDNRARERNEYAGYLPWGRLFAIEQKGDRRDQQRSDRDNQ